MTKTIVSAAALAMILASGCDSSPAPIDPTPTVEHAMTAQELGRLGAEIRNTPERADQILSEHGMTAEQLETEVRRVAADPEQSKAYREAFDAASQAETQTGG